MARDGLGREIDYLRISVTDRCNLGCLYCVPEKRPPKIGFRETLSGQEVVRIARVAGAFGVRKIRLTGGEPLLRPDILEVIRGVKATGVRDLSLTTNGTLLEGMAPALSAAGLDRVNVSLDTLKPERYRAMTGGGELEQVLSGIEAAEKAGLSPVKINMVPVRGLNDDEILDFARLTFQKPRHIRFIELMPSGRTEFRRPERCIRSEEIKRTVASLGKLTRRRFRGKGPSRNYRLEGAPGILGFISPVSHSFCYQCNRLRMNAAGKIRPCLFSRAEIDIAAPLRAGASDEELIRVLARAVREKPEGNALSRQPGKAAIPSMSSIGG
ncbi:MAG: GTP 3',8-cyclase MoaA [Nitrospirota bacterium]|jgi:cyclic pyranopterin phosphate synthase